MKKAINLIVMAVLVFLILTACSNKSDPTSNKGSNATKTPQVDISKISSITDFSNGLAFVKYKDDQNVYCIDKTGNQLFKLENCYINGFVKFNDKIAMIEAGLREFVLCDKNGNISKAEDFGASRIVLDTENHQQAFLDGYIILERREESYTGTKIEMSIMDSNFKTLVPFSAKLAEIINSDTMRANGTDYYDGYLYFDDTILDLRTGTKLSDRKEMKVSKPLLSYWSKGTYGGSFEHLQWGDIYNELTGEVVAKVKESKAISKITFVGNIGLAEYDSDNGTWFNVISQDGNAKFQPIKAEDSKIQFDGETILVVGNAYDIKKENGNVSARSLKTYDVNGNLLGEFIAETATYTPPYVSLNDGVIKVLCGNEYLLYNSALEELF